MADWQGLEGPVAQAISEQNDRLMETYRADPRRVEEDANSERSAVEGAYASRQIFELLQNATDAMRFGNGRCEVLLTDSSLYVANSGEPLTEDGVETLMAAHLSAKRDDQIGRFGLGFKSVLAVSDTPRIISHSGVMAFDREWSRDQLRSAFPDRDHYPVLRMAQAMDPQDLRSKDLELERLMRWATTVVHLPIAKHRDRLADGLRTFPVQFLLFSRHVARLDLEDRSGAARRMTLQSGTDGLLQLDDAGRKSRWVVQSQTHKPSKAALLDGGYQAARNSVDISWAAPVEGFTQKIGAFWAYFPTGELATLSGIVNAPWKLADDRESLLAGTFNDELLIEVLPSLISSALPKICGSERPGTVIDVLPARGKESRGHADKVINDPIMRKVAKNPCIPNLKAELRHPTRVKFYPSDLEAEDLEMWISVCPDPENWAHESLYDNAERRAKVDRLMGLHNRARVSMREWLEHLAKHPSVERSAVAVQLVARLLERMPGLRDELRSAKVLLLEDGGVQACQRGQVFLPGGQEHPGKFIIDPVLAADPRVDRALKSLGIEIFDDAGALRSELTVEPIRWDRVWSSARKAGVDEADEIFRDVLGDQRITSLRVRTFSGLWESPARAFLAGEVIPADGSRDQDYLIDPRFHGADRELLELLGCVESPVRLDNPPFESWRHTYEARAKDLFRREPGNSKVADRDVSIDTGRIPWPLEPLSQLSEDGRWALVRSYLRRMVGDEQWHVSRASSGKAYSFPDMSWSYVAKNGYLDTPIGIQPISRVIRREEEDLFVEGVEQPLPFADSAVSEEHASALRLKSDVSKLQASDWVELIAQARPWEMGRRVLLYGWAADAGAVVPSHIRAQRGRGHVDVPPTECAVTAHREVFDSLVEAEVPTLLALEEDAQILIEQWGLGDGDKQLVETLDPEPSGEPTLLVDLFPPLRNSLTEEQQDIVLQPCSRLTLLTSTPVGQKSKDLPSRLQGKTLYSTAQADRDVLIEIGRALDLMVRADVVLKRMSDQRQQKRRRDIEEASTLEEKLALAIGRDALLTLIPQAGVKALQAQLDRELTEPEVVKMALAVEGYSILQNSTRALRDADLDPPSMWAGLRPARAWVRSLNIPTEFAGVPGDRKAAELEVDGPPALGDLHDYQSRIAKNIKGLLSSDAEVNRGLVSLPTGAGKTRVAVQALVEHMAEQSGGFTVLWLAETEELCEQAVQTWSQVWSAHGKSGVPLTVSRLWAANEPSERDGLQVVVASLAKLSAVVERSDWEGSFGWLREPGLLVVDEAHKSIAPVYTRALNAISRTNRVIDMKTPLLGLTATPFRGYNTEETKRLAGRYHSNLLDKGVFPNDDVYGYLQRGEVLAKVKHTLLHGASVVLTPAELKDAEEFKRVPDSLSKRLGQDEVRNNSIVESIRDLPKDATALVFATSVENARVLAALLTYHGVEARAVSGETDASARRRYIEDFKAKRVRVLTNYNVFVEGFDVPKVDAVYITRPTFSPNVYQQMIGRGLRGPLNGGNSQVHIVNVADNFENFGQEFAFTHFEHLWA